jgi:hypothetical protein
VGCFLSGRVLCLNVLFVRYILVWWRSMCYPPPPFSLWVWVCACVRMGGGGGIKQNGHVIVVTLKTHHESTWKDNWR